MGGERTAAEPAWRVIGVGNRDRGDDGVGPYVCDRLRRQLGERAGERVVVCEGAVLDLALRWDTADRVVVVDAIAPGSRAGRIVTLDVTDDPVPPHRAVSTHGVDVSVAIELARALERMPAELVLVGIEAEQVRWGAPMSAAVVAAADTVVDHLIDRLTPIMPGVRPVGPWGAEW